MTSLNHFTNLTHQIQKATDVEQIKQQFAFNQVFSLPFINLLRIL